MSRVYTSSRVDQASDGLPPQISSDPVINFAPHALPVCAIGVVLPLPIGPGLRHPVLSVVLTIARTRVRVLLQVAPCVVLHRSQRF